MTVHENRKFMQCPSFREGMAQSDQSKEITPPPYGKEVKGATIEINVGDVVHNEYKYLLDVRRSKRKYEDTAMTKEQLAFMLWSVNGIQSLRGPGSFRPSPSGGARHPFETYIAVKNVSGLEAGIYLYHPVLNVGEKKVTIERLYDHPGDDKISEMLAGQRWAVDAPVVLFYSCVPYKAEWRYVNMAHRVMLIDLGHVGQNYMLSAVSLGLGSCCLAAYDQNSCDKALQINGEDEYTVYAVTVGKAK